MHNNYTAVAWLPRCKSVERSNKTLTRYSLVLQFALMSKYYGLHLIYLLKDEFFSLDFQKFDFLKFYKFSIFELNLPVQVKTYKCIIFLIYLYRNMYYLSPANLIEFF